MGSGFENDVLPPTPIVQDQREKVKLDGMETRTTEVGDIHYGNAIGIEHKTPGDFIGSIKDGRLFDQAHELAANFQKAFIVVDGSLANLLDPHTRGFMSTEAVMGAVASLTTKYGTPVLFVNERLYSWYVFTLVKKATDGSSVADYKPIRDRASPDDWAEAVLARFPRMGPKRAKAILKTFGSLKVALESIDLWADRVDGIGNTTAQSAKMVWENERSTVGHEAEAANAGRRGGT